MVDRITGALVMRRTRTIMVMMVTVPWFMVIIIGVVRWAVCVNM